MKYIGSVRYCKCDVVLNLTLVKLGDWAAYSWSKFKVVRAFERRNI